MKLKDVASSLRLEIVKMSNRAKAPHLASSLSCIDIIVTLYEKVLNIFPNQPNKLSRDKYVFRFLGLLFSILGFKANYRGSRFY